MLSTPCAEKGSASPARAATEGVAGDWLAAGSAMENATECGRARDCDSRVIGLQRNNRRFCAAFLWPEGVPVPRLPHRTLTRVCAKHACTSCCACRQTCCSDRPSTPTTTSAARLAVPLPAGTSRQPLSSPPRRQRATSRALPRLPSRPCSAQPQPPTGSRPPTPVPIAPRRSARPCQRPRHSDCYHGTTARCRRRMLPTAHAPHFPRLHGRRRCPRRCRCGRAQRRARRCWQGLVGASRRIRRAV